MGAGIAYRNGDGPEGALTYHNVQGTIGSFVAEGMSLNTCINSVPIDIPVTIGIDNAALIYDLERCTFETFWKTMEGHEHAEMLTQLVQNINKRTASTTSYNRGGLILSNFTILADIKIHFPVFGLYSNSVSISFDIQIYGRYRVILCTPG